MRILVQNQKIKTVFLSIILGYMTVIMLICSTAGAAVERDELRVRAGLDLFPSLLAADLDISKKQCKDGFLTLLLIYTDNRNQAEEMATILKGLEKIREIPIRVEISNDLSMQGFKDNKPAGIFLTQPLDKNFYDIVSYSINNSIILFSPFNGDVEKGAMGGLHISDRVLPFLNMVSMKSSGIHIKQFFIRVSVIYEQ